MIGAGLAGATTAYELGRSGERVRVFEKTGSIGGLIRTRMLDGVIYEPFGSHIFHTDDSEVWMLVNELVPYWPYQHRVRTMVRGRAFTWPIQAHEIEQLYGSKTARELVTLAAARASCSGDHLSLDFESWCLQLMPRNVYEDFVRSYTEKQWARPACELDADFAPQRVQARSDRDDRLFRDRHQGFPDASAGGTYELQMHRLLARAEVRLRRPLYLRTLVQALRLMVRRDRPRFVIVTAPLDEFAEYALGPLEWRGLRFAVRHFPGQGFAQERMVVNWPSADVPWIRTHEAKHATRQDVPGTVVVTEFAGGESKMYPVPGRDGRFRSLNLRYMERIAEALAAFDVRVAFVGRLATYRYQDQDEVIRDSLDTVRQLLGSERGATVAGDGARRMRVAV